MILDIGLDEMKILLTKRDKLKEVIEEAYEVFFYLLHSAS
jgi:hypothetical protein